MKRRGHSRLASVAGLCVLALAAGLPRGVAAAPAPAAAKAAPPAAKTAPPPEKAAPATEKAPAADKAGPGPGAHPRETSNATYKYYLYVPKGYSPDRPAGIHVYFHGQGGQGSAPDFGLWSKHFLEPFNLVGINMQYTDGDNGSDTSGKVEAAVEAIRKTAAELKIVLGRGAVGSFSGGGLPHAKLFAKFSKDPAAGPPCPFNHAALYGSNYWSSPTSEPPMSWFIGVGTGEWDMGQPTLGQSQTHRAEQLFQAALKGGWADVHFMVAKDKGHTIADADVQASAAQFRRSDLALAPFLYEADYADSPLLLPIVQRANSLALGQAAAALKRALADPKADAATRARAEALQAALDARVEAVLALAGELAETDPALCGFYGNAFARQLTGHPRAKDLKALLADARKQPAFAPATGAYRKFWTSFKDLLAGPHLKPGADRFIEGVRTDAGEKSLAGRMAAELLLLSGGPKP